MVERGEEDRVHRKADTGCFRIHGSVETGKAWLETLAASLRRRWSLRSCCLHVSIGLLQAPTEPRTPDTWFLDRVESLLRLVASPAAHC
jgi:hypothetical protein